MIKLDIEKVQAENPNSRFRLSNVAKLNPGTCITCGSAGAPDDPRQFIDFGKTIEWFGVVYICTFCLTEVAKLLNLRDQSTSDAEIDTLQNGCVERDLKIAELEENLNAARLLLRNCHCDDTDFVSDGNVSDSVDVESSEESDPIVDDASESPGVEGSSSFPKLADLHIDELESAEPKRRSRKSTE